MSCYRNLKLTFWGVALTSKNSMDNIVQLLQTYRGHGKIMRTTSNVCMLFATATSGKLASDLRLIGKQILGATLVERFFDDIIALSSTIGYGWGSEEKDTIIRVLQILFNITWQVSYPIEHVSWLCEQTIIPMNFKPWFTATISCMACAMFILFLKSLYTLKKLQAHKKKLQSMNELTEEGSSALKEVRNQVALEVLHCVAKALDVINLVNTLPRSVLWGGRLTARTTALIGTTSNFIGLYTGK